ncbi:MAG: acyl carrier protein [Lachnospiraceae bacterium]|nr:acyl carrier protein [Lachnospiraceae bacterium]
MTREEILEKATAIFRDVFDDESIVLTEETTAADIEDWDSLMHITLINEIEEAFGYKFGMKEVLGMKNVGEMCDILEKNT